MGARRTGDDNGVPTTVVVRWMSSCSHSRAVVIYTVSMVRRQQFTRQIPEPAGLIFQMRFSAQGHE